MSRRTRCHCLSMDNIFSTITNSTKSSCGCTSPIILWNLRWLKTPIIRNPNAQFFLVFENNTWNSSVLLLWFSLDTFWFHDFFQKNGFTCAVHLCIIFHGKKWSVTAFPLWYSIFRLQCFNFVHFLFCFVFSIFMRRFILHDGRDLKCDDKQTFLLPYFLLPDWRLKGKRTGNLYATFLQGQSIAFCQFSTFVMILYNFS